MKIRCLKQKIAFFITSFCLYGFVCYNANSDTSIKRSKFLRGRTELAVVKPNYLKNEETKETFHCEDVYVGCFTLDVMNNMFTILHSHMSRGDCVLACSEKQSSYAGLTKGNTCVCSSEVRSIADTLKPGKCDEICPGKSIETCGGARSIDVIQILSPCFLGNNVPEFFEETRYLGYFTNDDNNTFGKVELLAANSTTLCILRCGLEKYPLAATDAMNEKCICGWFTENFNLLHRVETCEISSLKIYRTLAEDKRCSHPQFLPFNSDVKRSVLTSFPGSGNTWTRHLIEQASQVFTGSKYNDGSIYKSGMLGEITDVESNRTFVIKSHLLRQDIIETYDIHSVILIMRNPYDALLSEYNRRHSHGHTSLANTTLFYSKDFFGFTMNSRWMTKFDMVIASKLPFHVLIYENLVHDPIFEIRKVMKFLELNNGFRQPNLEQRLLCLAENLQGQNKRTSRKLNSDPYSKEMISKINSDIAYVRQRISSNSIRITLPRYEKFTS